MTNETNIWQPIETAPKDCSPILVSLAGTDLVEIAAHADKSLGRFRGNPWRIGSSVGRTLRFSPTHWMPRPKPPTNL